MIELIFYNNVVALNLSFEYYWILIIICLIATWHEYISSADMISHVL